MPAWILRYRAAITAAIALVLLGVAFTALHHLTHQISLAEAREALHSIPASHVALALGFTAISYLALTFYDVLALRTIGRPLPWRTAAAASFTSYTLSHNLGLSALTGGSARYRVYSAAGLEAGDIARIVVIAGFTFWMGVVIVAGAALMFPGTALDLGLFTLSPLQSRLTGTAILLCVAGFFLFTAFGPRVVSVRSWSLPIPKPREAVAQAVVGAIDLAAASAALFILVPGAHAGMLPAFILAYALALLAGLITHVPGGLGVFEATIIAVLPGDKAALLAALVAYRVIYYLLPLALGVSLIVAMEGRRFHSFGARSLSNARMLVGSVAPPLLGISTFIGGAVLLFSGALPALPARLVELRHVVPLPFIEASHIAASLVGTALLLLAPGLYRRLDGAFVAARALLLAGAIFAIARGFDYEEAIVLLGVAALLQWTRPAFYRQTTLLAEPLSIRWMASVVAVIGVSVWIGFFAYKHVEYTDSLWWDFAWHGNASRFLRGSFAAAVLVAGYAVWRLLSPAPPRPESDTVSSETLAQALTYAEHTDAMLAFTGDKRFLVSPEGDAFLMYQVKGRSWVVMGDPVGPSDTWPDLLWRIRGMADAAQGRLVLYQITGRMLSLAIELGLQIIKYGEEAFVELGEFSLEGAHMRTVRQAERRAGREGATFELVPARDVPTLMPELREVSDEWLNAKGHKEKGFSLGRFDPAYLSLFDFAVVRKDGRIVAFANLWTTPDKGEISVDLMRHARRMPSGTMEFLFAHIMLWAQAQGYRRMSFGLAPLSGIDAHRLSPTWAKAAALLFNHGERFYGFKGLRAYKDKYAPAWEPRFIAGPTGLSLVQALLDLNALISAAPGDALPAGAWERDDTTWLARNETLPATEGTHPRAPARGSASSADVNRTGSGITATYQAEEM